MAPSGPQETKRSSAAAGLLLVLVLSALVALAARAMGIDWRLFSSALRGVSPLAVAGCMVAAVLALVFQALRWRTVLEPFVRLRYADALRAQVVGSMFNALLPARAGDLMRVHYLGRFSGISRARLLGTEVVDRWLDWLGWIPTFLVVCLAGDTPGWLVRVVGLFAAGLAALALLFLALERSGGLRLGGARVERVMAAFREGVAVLRRPRTWALGFTIAAVPWLCEAGAIALFGGGLGVELTLPGAFAVIVAFNFGYLVPSPGAIGAVEAAGTGALVLAGANPAAALAFMCVYHLTQMGPSIVWGLLILVLSRGWPRPPAPGDQGEAQPPA